jgi:hypothetical protein
VRFVRSTLRHVSGSSVCQSVGLVDKSDESATLVARRRLMGCIAAGLSIDGPRRERVRTVVFEVLVLR